MRILIITDAASPQVNGVVRTLDTTVKILKSRGYNVMMIVPSMFDTFSLPMYPEIKVAISTSGLEDIMKAYDPDCVHIATEGRLGWAARGLCEKLGWAFSTAYHTDFPRYLNKYYKVPVNLTYSILRKFHNAGSAMLVSTDSVEDELVEHGFRNIRRWGRGVDVNVFNPRGRGVNAKPVLLSVGRVSKEKNLEVFFELDMDVRKVVVGDGPMLTTYRKKYPDVEFLGPLKGDALALQYSNADVFVFPSKSDTFGLVIIESLACGTPVAAYPVQGPKDILTASTGAMSEDLAVAVREALTKDRLEVSKAGREFTWDAATDQFLSALVIR